MKTIHDKVLASRPPRPTRPGCTTEEIRLSRRTRDEVEVALLAFELTERRVALVLSVAMTIVAVLCTLRGSPWPISAGTGLAAIGFGAAKQRRCGGECDRGERQ
jgi:hypothetical protein